MRLRELNAFRIWPQVILQGTYLSLAYIFKEIINMLRGRVSKYVTKMEVKQL
jgi:hypothetical protein